jgi:hypothetical protein
MVRFTKKPLSGSQSQYLAKTTSLVQCRYRPRTDTVYASTVHNTHATQVILCRHSTDRLCTTSISTLNQACNFS